MSKPIFLYPNDKLDTYHREKAKKKKSLESYIFGEDIPWVQYAISDFDDTYGISLNDPSVWLHPHEHKLVVCANAMYAIRAMMCVINGIPVKEYLGEPVSIPLEHLPKSSFTKHSTITWENRNRIPIQTPLFRRKFATMLLSGFLPYVEKIAKNYCRSGVKRMGEDEREIIVIKNMIHDLNVFSQLMASKYSLNYSNSLVKTICWLNYNKKKNVAPRFNQILVDHIIYSKKYAKEDPATGVPYHNDEETIGAIIETAYMLATGEIEDWFGYLPTPKCIKGVTRKHDIIELIEGLGGAVLVNNGNSSVTPAYRAFKGANPIVISEYPDEAKRNSAIREGLLALAFVEFVYHDHTMCNFIQTLLSRG